VLLRTAAVALGLACVASAGNNIQHVVVVVVENRCAAAWLGGGVGGGGGQVGLSASRWFGSAGGQ
jgi:hypothetical protein